MTPAEFKAWLNTFTSKLNGKPTEFQAAQVKAKFASVDWSTETRPAFQGW
jgi:hypothetical protein